MGTDRKRFYYSHMHDLTLSRIALVVSGLSYTLFACILPTVSFRPAIVDILCAVSLLLIMASAYFNLRMTRGRPAINSILVNMVYAVCILTILVLSVFFLCLPHLIFLRSF